MDLSVREKRANREEEREKEKEGKEGVGRSWQLTGRVTPRGQAIGHKPLIAFALIPVLPGLVAEFRMTVRPAAIIAAGSGLDLGYLAASMM